MRDYLVNVLINIPIFEEFSYKIPKFIDKNHIKKGSRVLVPFRNKNVVGIVIGFSVDNKKSKINFKQIKEILDIDPLIDEKCLELSDWASRYYHHPQGEVINHFLTPSLRKGAPASLKKKKYWSLTTKGEFTSDEDLSRAPKQLVIIRTLREVQELDLMSIKAHGLSRSSIESLKRKGYIKETIKETKPILLKEGDKTKFKKLTEEQQRGLEKIVSSNKRSPIFLINGITGSGKTELYLRAIDEVTKKGKQVLVLIPEIGLTPQLESRFRELFGDKVVSIHSAKNENEKIEAWLGAKRGDYQIIIGTRSSAFTPFKDLGLIVIDEEHDPSYKQSDRFRYSARDLSIYRAKLNKIPTILASATPSLESLRNVSLGFYDEIVLKERATGAKLPSFSPVDLRGKELNHGFSQELVDEIEEELSQENQVLIFINRRGYASSLICKECGWISTCQRCDAHMTLHLNPPLMQCHHCGKQDQPPKKCPSCFSDEFEKFGLGTERVEEFLRQKFNGHSVIRIDSDSTRRKDSFEDYINLIRKGSPAILVGTQMLAKGHHFPDVTLVGILDADFGLFSADFRGSERMAQLITQVSGRAGREKKPGKVVIQTYCPDHPQMEKLIFGSYYEFSDYLLEIREESKSPPFSYLAKVHSESVNSNISRNFLAALLNDIKLDKELRVIGPVPSLMEKKSGIYRWEVSFLSEKRSLLHKSLDLIQNKLKLNKKASKVRWSIEVDPTSSL